MNHSFIPSNIDSNLCGMCKHTPIDHTDMATCECCPTVGPVEIYMTMLMCPSCIVKETEAQVINSSPAKQAERVSDMNANIVNARAIDDSISVRSDLFNAATVSIIELKEMIDKDESIVNKPYALAEILTNRYQQFKSVVFELSEKIVDAGNKQKAIQVYLNQLANTLRAEEREKLKIADINYKPPTPKIKVGNIKSVTKKFDKVELRKYALELGINEFTLQMVSVQKGLSI